jgi:hypothetical protein
MSTKHFYEEVTVREKIMRNMKDTRKRSAAEDG